MKTTSAVLGVLLASVLMTACAKKEAPAEVPAETPAPAEAAPAPAEAAPAEAAATTDAVPNDEDAGQTSGDKVAPKN